MNPSSKTTRKLVAPAVLAALASLCGSAFAATPIQDWQIIEGRGLTDDYVYLGMTRAEAQAVALNGNCNGTVKQCTFRASPDTGAITLYFSKKDKVNRIDINQTGVGTQWPTTAGATDSMSAAQVHGLYPGSRLFRSGVNTNQVDAKTVGYSYAETIICADQVCNRTTTNAVYKAKGR